MDNKWQVKCGSILQSTTPFSAPTTSQQSVNQVHINSGQLLYPAGGLDLRSQLHGRMIDHTFHSSGHADLGNSYLALLSGPASLLQCDFQDFSNPRLSSSSCKLPIEGGIGAMSANGIESRSLFKSSGFLSENLSYQNLLNGAASSSISVFPYGLEDSCLAKATTHHINSGNEKIKGLPSMGGEWPNINTANAVKLQNGNCQSQQKMPIEDQHSVSNTPFSFLYGCPRVVCSSTSGYLLLSNTGLLGILCSCHRFHMSVSKFCEHSGFCNVNPGDAVCMESGETIAQWRKLYFQKFGIRVPDDQSGWNWPEGLSLTASLVKSGVSMPMSKNSDRKHLVGSSGGVVRSREPIDNIVLSKNSFADQNSVIDALHNKPQRNCQDGNKFLGLVGTSESSLHGVRGSQVMDCPMFRHSAVPSVFGRGPENGSQSMSAYIDSIANTGSMPATNPSLPCLRAVLTNSDVCRANGKKNVLIVDNDAASSSIELRLGQPNQQSQSSGNQALSKVGPRIYNALVDSQKPFSEEQMIHYVTNSGEGRQSRQHLSWAAGLSYSAKRAHNQLNHGYCPISNTRHVVKRDKLKGDMAGTSVPSLNGPPGSGLYSKATNNVMSISEHAMPEMLHCESHTAKCNPVNVHWNGETGLEREWSAQELGFVRPTDRVKAVGCLSGNSYSETVSGSKMQKLVENTSSSTGMVGGNKYSDLPAVHDKSCCSHHLSSLLPGASNAVSFSNYLEKVPCYGSRHVDHAFVQSVGSPMGCAKIMPSQGVSLGANASTSAPISGLPPELLQQEGIGISPCLLDDNLRLLALRQILELSKQQHALSSLGENQELGRYNDKAHHSLVEPSASGELRHGPYLWSRKYVSEIPMKPIQFGPSSNNDNNKLTPVTGLNNWHNFSTLTREMPLQCEGIDVQCQLSHGPPQSEQHSLRLGRTEINMTFSSEHEHETCSQGTLCVQENCGCSTHKKCLGGKRTLREVNPPNSFKEQMGGVNGKAPSLIAPHFVKNDIVPKETNVSLDQCEKLRGQLPKNISYHTSQWKDVPSKTKGVCELACVKQSADISGRRGQEMGRLGDITVKCSNVFFGAGAVHTEDSFREQEISNISSGCSTPAVTQASIEVSNMDSSSIVAANTGYINDLIVDEGSGIDKCCSSDDALESDRSADFSGSACMKNLRKDTSFKVFKNQSSHSLLDEVKLIDSLTWKRGQKNNQIHTGSKVLAKSNHFQEFGMGLKTGKRKTEIKLKMLDASLDTGGPVVCDKYPKCDGTADWPRFSKDLQMASLGQETSHSAGAHPTKPGSKRGKSTLSLAKPLSRKRDLHGEDDCKAELINNASSCKIVETSRRKKFKSSGTTDDCIRFQTQEPTQSVDEKAEDYNLVSCISARSSQHVNVCNRPVVHGKYGVISKGETTGDVPAPVKIVSLDKILKTANRCRLPKSCRSKQSLPKELKRAHFSFGNTCSDKFSNLRKENESNDALGFDGMNLHDILKGESVSTSGDKQCANQFLPSEKKRGDKNRKVSSVVDTKTHGQSKAKFKKICRHGLYELTSKGKNSSSEMASHRKIFNSAPKTKVRKPVKNPEYPKLHVCGSRKVNSKRYIQERRQLSTMDLFCCVCGSSNQDDVNCLLECGLCLIRVHQACYGVSKAPKGPWCCRPCRTNSRNIVCVLCGYGGGAMTRALRCRTIMKTLLRAWSLETEISQKNENLSAETFQDELSMLHTSGPVLENSSYPVLQPVDIEPSTSAAWSADMQNQFDTSQSSLGCASNLKVNNSITAGILDSTIKQWVHMVCGLWTPGTRCPNVDTMSAFDVSGASYSSANVVCSLCKRPGGSCIQCRVVNCSIQFHPWCAHKKGLLQSEVEGVDNESVGFYGRCLLHATCAASDTAFDVSDVRTDCPGENKASCARTEGYKGRKRDGFWHNLHGQSRGKGGCLVPQEQLNAWIHINGQKSCAQGLSKLPMSDMEYDCRKEYTRYKQAKRWKHLVVYKSGIHALGLYTSQFITRGEMVVEYVGEIVGHHVADKREIEYQSGRKLQYKSACYFFRIDKEHIIDATRKGGIARFVNHSCLPNCVAKVISVRNEKKVVFFAERDINPGEEITYDYHFNHEDEGKKISCFCNSKNCRRYLN